jgi:hypothetical protein
MAVERIEAPTASQAPAKAKTVEVIVSIADAYLDQAHKVVQRCRRAGLRVKELLEEIGIVYGSIDTTKIATLRRVTGVAAVEESRQIQLPPDNADVH